MAAGKPFAWVAFSAEISDLTVDHLTWQVLSPNVCYGQWVLSQWKDIHRPHFKKRLPFGPFTQKWRPFLVDILWHELQTLELTSILLT